MRTFATVAAAAIAALAGTAAAAEHCTVATDTYTYARTDPALPRAVDSVNSRFSSGAGVQEAPAGLDMRLANARTISRNVQTLEIEVSTDWCRPLRTAAMNATAGNGRQSTPFDALPPGSTVEVSACNADLATSSKYLRQADGRWMLTGVGERRVQNCTIGKDASAGHR